jgi:hypothetical protein
VVNGVVTGTVVGAAVAGATVVSTVESSSPHAPIDTTNATPHAIRPTFRIKAFGTPTAHIRGSAAGPCAMRWTTAV